MAANSKNTARPTLQQVCLIVLLVFSLLHTLSLLAKGSDLATKEREEFRAAHKQQFLQSSSSLSSSGRSAHSTAANAPPKATSESVSRNEPKTTIDSHHKTTTTAKALLNRLRILVAIASFDFSQIPHFEETLDGYHELCVSGAMVDVVVHTTVIFPVAWLDLWQTRFPCDSFSIQFHIHNKAKRLHLVDLHRGLFYEHLEEYDLFIYTEDDIRLTPTTVVTYWHETQSLKARKDVDNTLYNVGIVRYEYNFPSVVIDDKTRHATENVTRIFWEHSMAVAQSRPIIGGAVEGIPSLNTDESKSHGEKYVHMKNHHQGMFLATRQHLEKWRDLPNCQFDKVQDRPGLPNNPKQPLLGTQRVWMSSYQLFEPKYCNIQQVLPVSKFGALTVHHVPNKNYRRKTKSGTTLLNHGNGTSSLEINQGSKNLVTAMQLHLAMQSAFPSSNARRKISFKIHDYVNHQRPIVLDDRLNAFREYVARGGVLSEEDRQHTDLITWEERLAELERKAERERRQRERQGR